MTPWAPTPARAAAPRGRRLRAADDAARPRRPADPAATATAAACAAGWSPPRCPLARSRAEQFDDLVLDAVEDLERRWERELAGVEFAVEDVPWVEHTSPDEVVLDADVLDDGSVPLARVLPAHRENGRERPAADRRLPAAAGDPRARPRRPRRPRARRRRRPGGRAAGPRPGGDRPHLLGGVTRRPAPLTCWAPMSNGSDAHLGTWLVGVLIGLALALLLGLLVLGARRATLARRSARTRSVQPPTAAAPSPGAGRAFADDARAVGSRRTPAGLDGGVPSAAADAPDIPSRPGAARSWRHRPGRDGRRRRGGAAA